MNTVSAQSTERAKVKFINRTNKRVEVVWLGFSGELILYKVLEPHQFIDINTFTNHYWVAIESVKRDNLHLNNKEIFYVKSFHCIVRQENVERVVTQAEVRIPVIITLPLDTLKTLAIKVVRDLIGSKENIKYLEMPNVLKSELEESFDIKNKNIFL